MSRDSKRRLDIQMMVSCRFIRSHFYRLLFFISNPACCFSAAAGANKQQQKTTDNLYVTFASFVAFVYQMNTKRRRIINESSCRLFVRLGKCQEEGRKKDDVSLCVRLFSLNRFPSERLKIHFSYLLLFFLNGCHTRDSQRPTSPKHRFSFFSTVVPPRANK